MPSGRKNRIMIACVTFETSKVVEPALYYEVNRAHIIHYVKDPDSESGMVYDSFRRRVCERLRDESPREVELVMHNERVSDFSVMLRTVLSIIQAENRGEEGCEIYVNISSGSPEYAAAAAVASMMVPGTIPFSVGTREYTVPADRIRDVYFVDGEPVGLTMSTYPPRAMPVYAIDMPEEHLIRGLRILSDRNDSRLSVTSGRMVQALKEAGLWYRDTETDDPRAQGQPAPDRGRVLPEGLHLQVAQERLDRQGRAAQQVRPHRERQDRHRHVLHRLTLIFSSDRPCVPTSFQRSL